MSDEDTVLTERRGPVAIVTLNRPQAMNALSRALRAELARTFDALDRDSGVRAVVLTGAGDRAFSAGLDLKEMGSDPRALGSVGERRPADDPLRAIESCRHPVIAAINGVAVTGGFELALGCDVLLAAPNARFADTHVRVGVLPGWGLSQKLARIVGPSRAKELSLTGRFIDAEKAADWGIVSRVVPQESLLDEAVAVGAAMAEADPEYLQALKRLIDEGLDGTLSDGRAMERERSKAWNEALSPETLEAKRENIMNQGRKETGAS